MQRLKLSPSELGLIQEVVARRAPDLSYLVDRLLLCPLPSITLSDAEAHELANLLIDEFCAKGLGENDEPNPYGKQLDSIIGILYFRG